MPAILDEIAELELGPAGWLLAAVGGALVLSPETRKLARRALVRGAAAVISATEGIRRRGAELREGWEDLVAEAHTELEAKPELAPENA